MTHYVNVPAGLLSQNNLSRITVTEHAGNGRRLPILYHMSLYLPAAIRANARKSRQDALSGKFYNTQLHQVVFCKFSNCRFYNDGSISVFRTITSCTFESCTLEKDNFTKIAVTNTLFSNNIFNGILMTWASMKENTFKSPEMNGGSAESFNFEEIDLETPGKFHNVTMKECNFSSLVLDGWEFSGCKAVRGELFRLSYLYRQQSEFYIGRCAVCKIYQWIFIRLWVHSDKSKESRLYGSCIDRKQFFKGSLWRAKPWNRDQSGRDLSGRV